MELHTLVLKVEDIIQIFFVDPKTFGFLLTLRLFLSLVSSCKALEYAVQQMEQVKGMER